MTDHYSPPPAGLRPGSRVWAYLRDSGGNAQERSVDQQEHEIVQYCEDHNLLIVQFFRDVARSAGSTVGRDEFLSMIDMSEEESLCPDGLLVWNFARFARDYNDSAYYKATLKRRGIVIHSLTDKIPDDDFAGRIVETVIDLANEEKRRQTSRDVKRGLRSLVSKGFAPGVPPRGYKAVKVTIGEKRDGSPRVVSKWEPDPDLWDDVILAWQMRADGKSYQEITDMTKGRIYKNANCWTTFFRNKAFLGYGISGDLEIRDHHEAAITWEIWETVQKINHVQAMRIKGSLLHPRRVGNPTILSGFTYCLECGSMMTHSTGNKKHPWRNYLCGTKDRQNAAACSNRRVGAANAERAIIKAVMDQVLTNDYLLEVIEETKKRFTSTDEIERQIETCNRKILDLDIAIQRTLNAIEKTGSQSAQDRLKQREVERMQTQLEINRLRVDLANAQVEITPDAIQLILAAWSNQITKAQETGSARELKAWLMQFVSRIDLGYNKARIHYTYPLIDFSEMMPRNIYALRGGTG